MIASFSRALLQGLSDGQTDEEFNAVLDGSIEQIFEASVKKMPASRSPPATLRAVVVRQFPRQR